MNVLGWHAGPPQQQLSPMGLLPLLCCTTCVPPPFSSVQNCAPLPAGKTLAFLLPLCMRVRALRQAAEEAAEEGEGEEGEEREAELEAEAEGLKAVVVR